MNAVLIMMCIVALLILINIVIDFIRNRRYVYCLMSKDNSDSGYILHGVFSSPAAAERHITDDHASRGDWVICEAVIDISGNGDHLKYLKHVAGFKSNI